MSSATFGAITGGAVHVWSSAGVVGGASSTSSDVSMGDVAATVIT